MENSLYEMENKLKRNKFNAYHNSGLIVLRQVDGDDEHENKHGLGHRLLMLLRRLRRLNSE
jgi:hypothetical protein